MGAFLSAAIGAMALVAVTVVIGYSASKSKECGTKKLQIGVAGTSSAVALVMIVVMALFL